MNDALVVGGLDAAGDLLDQPGGRVLIGAAVVLLSLQRGEVFNRFGSWD